MAYEINVVVTIAYRTRGIEQLKDTTRAVKEQEGILCRTIENWKRTFAVFALGYVSVVGFLSVVRLIPRTFREAIAVSSEYEKSIVSLAALLLSFSRAPEKYGPATAMQLALQYSESLFQAARRLDAQFIGTADELLEAARALIAHGIMINTQREEDLRLWLGIATGAKLLTLNIQRQGQLYQEIHAFLQGNARLGAELAKWAAAVDPEYQKNIKSLKTLEERKAYLLKLAEKWLTISKVIGNTWDAISSTFKVIFQDILVRGFKPFFDWLKSTFDKINQSLRQSGKESATFLAIVKALNTFSLKLVSFFQALISVTRFIIRHWETISLILKSLVLVFLVRKVTQLALIRNLMSAIVSLMQVLILRTVRWGEVLTSVLGVTKRLLPILIAMAAVEVWERYKEGEAVKNLIQDFRKEFESLSKESKKLKTSFEELFPPITEVFGAANVQYAFLEKFFIRLRETHPELIYDLKALAMAFQAVPIQEYLRQIYASNVTQQQLDKLIQMIAKHMAENAYTAEDLSKAYQALASTLKLPPTEEEAKRVRSTLEELRSQLFAFFDEEKAKLEERRTLALEELERRAEKEILTWKEIADLKIAIENEYYEEYRKLIERTKKEIETLYDREISRAKGERVKELQAQKFKYLSDLREKEIKAETEHIKRISDIQEEYTKKIMEFEEERHLRLLEIMRKEAEIRAELAGKTLSLEKKVDLEVMKWRESMLTQAAEWFKAAKSFYEDLARYSEEYRQKFPEDMERLKEEYLKIVEDIETAAAIKREEIRLRELREEREREIEYLLEMLEIRKELGVITEAEYWRRRLELLSEYYSFLLSMEEELKEKYGDTAVVQQLINEIMKERTKMASELGKAMREHLKEHGNFLQGILYQLQIMKSELPSAFEVGMTAAQRTAEAMSRAFSEFIDVTSEKFLNFGELVRTIILSIYQELLKLLVIQPLITAIFGFIGGLIPLSWRYTTWIRMQEGGVAPRTPSVAILEKGERVLTPRQTAAFERLVDAITSARISPSSIQIINVVDPNTLTQYLMTPPGQQTVLNIIAANQRKVLKMLAEAV